MEKYHKIQTVYLRDPATNYKTLLEGQFSCHEFEYLAANDWIFTEKIDGTNIRVSWEPEVEAALGRGLEFGGRTDKAQTPTFLLSKLHEMFTVEKFASLYPETPMILFGEGYGAKIQKGGGNYIPNGVSFILFDVVIGGHYLERENVQDIADHLEIEAVPIIGSGTLLDAVTITRNGFPSMVGTQMAEGIVMRPAVELVSRTGHRIISKIKHKDFR